MIWFDQSIIAEKCSVDLPFQGEAVLVIDKGTLQAVTASWGDILSEEALQQLQVRTGCGAYMTGNIIHVPQLHLDITAGYPGPVLRDLCGLWGLAEQWPHCTALTA